MMSTLFRPKAVKQQNEQKYKMLQLFLAAGILGIICIQGVSGEGSV